MADLTKVFKRAGGVNPKGHRPFCVIWPQDQRMVPGTQFTCLDVLSALLKAEPLYCFRF